MNQRQISIFMGACTLVGSVVTYIEKDEEKLKLIRNAIKIAEEIYEEVDQMVDEED